MSLPYIRMRCAGADGAYRDYYAAVLRTHNAYVAPTQGQLLNYVQRVPLGVVAQITVSTSSPPFVP